MEAARHINLLPRRITCLPTSRSRLSKILAHSIARSQTTLHKLATLITSLPAASCSTPPSSRLELVSQSLAQFRRYLYLHSVGELSPSWFGGATVGSATSDAHLATIQKHLANSCENLLETLRKHYPIRVKSQITTLGPLEIGSLNLCLHISSLSSGYGSS